MEGLGPITGDVAWGGNWFFLVKDHGQNLAAEQRRDTDGNKLAHPPGRHMQSPGREVDHIELWPRRRRQPNFVLCPGKAYDRSPCGTGTSAKLACLAADGKLAPGENLAQESIVGSCLRSHLPARR